MRLHGKNDHAHPNDVPGDLDEILRAELPGFLLANGIGGFVWDFAADEVALQPGALAVFDLEPEEFDGRMETLLSRVEYGDLPWGSVADATPSTPGYGGYFQVNRQDGEKHWAHVQGIIQFDHGGNPVRSVGTLRTADIELDQASQSTVLTPEQRCRRDVVQSISAGLAQVLTVDDLLAFVTGGPFLELVGASGVALSVTDHDRRRLLATSGLPQDLLRDLGVARIEAPLPIAQAIRYQTPLFVRREDIHENYPLLWPYIERTELTATAILPLAAQARPTGALAILYTGKSEFTPGERDLLLAMAGSFAQCLQRAVMYDQEHSMAVALQQSMLPARIAEVAGARLAVRYLPVPTGHQVGGDWYDVIAFADGRVGLVVGDVQGHDALAAAAMGQLRAAFRAYAMEGHPAAIAMAMARTSAFLHEMGGDLLATCICVCLDPATGRGRIVRAGHPRPLVRRADHSTAPVEAKGGLPLGLERAGDDPYPTTDFLLGVGETLLLYTDGLLESRNPELDLGESRIRIICDEGPDDLDELAGHIISGVEKLQGQEDDVVLLLATRTSVS